MDSIWLVKQVLRILYDSYSHQYSVVGVALELKCIVETNTIRVNQQCKRRYVTVTAIKGNCTLVTR